MSSSKKAASPKAAVKHAKEKPVPSKPKENRHDYLRLTKDIVIKSGTLFDREATPITFHEHAHACLEIHPTVSSCSGLQVLFSDDVADLDCFEVVPASEVKPADLVARVIVG